MNKRFKIFDQAKFRKKEHEQTVDEKLDSIEKAVRRLNLQYNFKAMKTLLDVENITFGLLRCAQFYDGNNFLQDTNLATYYLVLAGLYGSGQIADITSDESKDAAYKILDNWQDKYGSLTFLFLLLIKQLEERHFFMDSTELEMIQKISSNNSYKSYVELISSVLTQELRETLQVRHIQNVLGQHILDTTTT